jgi:hypothetical protein
MDNESILKHYGHVIDEADCEDGYGEAIPNCTFWYCGVCDADAKTPEMIVHTTTCTVGIGIKLLVCADAAEAECKRLREALTYIRDYADAPVKGDLYAAALMKIAMYAEAALAQDVDAPEA